MLPIRTLTSGELPLYRDHLLRFGEEDRRLRFGMTISDEAVIGFVNGLGPVHDRVFAHLDARLRVIGAVHVAVQGREMAEFAFSVEEPHRGRGVGSALFQRAILWARNRGIRAASIYCLAENHGMRRLARRHGMDLQTDGGTCEGRMTLPRPSALSLVREAMAENAGLCDFSVKANSLALHRFCGLMPAV